MEGALRYNKHYKNSPGQGRPQRRWQQRGEGEGDERRAVLQTLAAPAAQSARSDPTSAAQRVGCAVQTIRKFESGELRPSRPFAERLAARLELPEEERGPFV